MDLSCAATHYRNVNLHQEHRARAELVIPRYHELVPKQEMKKVSSPKGRYTSLEWKRNHICFGVIMSTCGEKSTAGVRQF